MVTYWMVRLTTPPRLGYNHCYVIPGIKLHCEFYGNRVTFLSKATRARWREDLVEPLKPSSRKLSSSIQKRRPFAERPPESGLPQDDQPSAGPKRSHPPFLPLSALASRA